MSICVSKIGTVPTKGFDWYIILLDTPFNDPIHEQVDKYFMTLGKESGPDVLVVRGYDATAFRNSVVEAPAFNGLEDWKKITGPTLVVTNALSTDKNPGTKSEWAVQRESGLDQAKVMIFPLAEIYAQDKDLSIFFGKLIAALHSDEASEALDKVDKSMVEKYWSWISKYVELKPQFHGFKVDLEKIVADMLAKTR